MKRYSEAGKHYETLSRMLSCLILFIVLAVIGFATLPSLLLINVGPTSEAGSLHRNIRSTNVPADSRKGACSRTFRADSGFSAGSGVTKTVIIGDFRKGSLS